MAESTAPIHGVKLAPIVIKEAEQEELFDLLMSAVSLRSGLYRGMNSVLRLMLTNGLTMVPERQAVFFNCEFISREISMVRLIEQIGDSFPDSDFAKNCLRFAPEKVSRAIENNLICSHQNRSPEDSKWGGSARITFRLVSRTGQVTHLTIVGAASGLKEWEDMCLFLGALHYLKLIRLEDQQVQNILDAADASVAGQPDFLPEGMSIKQYAENLFLKIATVLRP